MGCTSTPPPRHSLPTAPPALPVTAPRPRRPVVHPERRRDPGHRLDRTSCLPPERSPAELRPHNDRMRKPCSAGYLARRQSLPLHPLRKHLWRRRWRRWKHRVPCVAHHFARVKLGARLTPWEACAIHRLPHSGGRPVHTQTPPHNVPLSFPSYSLERERRLYALSIWLREEWECGVGHA